MRGETTPQFNHYREHLLPTTGLEDPDLLNARIIGQERSGGVLFSWSVPGDAGAEGGGEGEGGVEGGEATSKGVSYVGWHVLNTKSFIKLYK